MVTAPPTHYVKIDGNGHIHVYVQNAADAKLAIKSLRILKKELTLQKREVTSQQRAIRSEYTNRVRRRGSKFPGGGNFGRFIRIWQSSSRDSERNSLATMLEPLENTKQNIEAALIEADRKTAEMEALVLCSDHAQSSMTDGE